MQFEHVFFKIKFLGNIRQWVVPENIHTPTTGGIYEFRMHGGVVWPGIPNAMGGSVGLEFRMHEGVSSPGILKGGGLKTLIY